MLERAAHRRGVPVESVWLATPSLEAETPESLRRFAAFWAVPATPYASMEGALRAIRFAHESAMPFLGTCGGFQHAMIEYARNVLDLAEADNVETSPDTALPLIAPLSCALVEKSGMIHFENGSRLRAIYGVTDTVETYHCSYGLNPRFAHLIERADARGARDAAGETAASSSRPSVLVLHALPTRTRRTVEQSDPLVRHSSSPPRGARTDRLPRWMPGR